MRAVRAEFLKLKRSLSWTVVVMLPVAIVLAGAASTLAAGERLDDGWDTMWLRSVVFYGLFPLAVGIGVLASLVWRVEHRDGNWNALMSGTTSSIRIVFAKAAVVAALAAAMQTVLFVTMVAVGKVAFGLPGLPPGEYLGISALIALSCVPVAVLQSGISMLMRSFAAPIAAAFLGAGVSVALLLAELDAAIFFVPYALVGRATQLGTGTFADDGSISAGNVASTAIAAVILTIILTTVTATVLGRRDIST